MRSRPARLGRHVRRQRTAERSRLLLHEGFQQAQSESRDAPPVRAEPRAESLCRWSPQPSQLRLHHGLEDL
eukprot:7145969-Prymnesium_polylepis.1